MHRPPGIVFVRLRPAKIAQQPILQVLRHLATIALDHLGTGGMIAPQDIAVVLRVELPSQGGGIHYVTK
jgi:hypothetical protein